MKKLLCIFLLTATSFGQSPDARSQAHRDKNGCQAAVLLAPSDDQNIIGAHALIFRDPANPDFTLRFALDPTGEFPPITIHSPFAEAADYYTHADAGFRAPYINFYKSRGTRAFPMPVTFTGYELDSIGGINFGGWDGSRYYAGASILTQVDEDWTPTNHGSHISIYGINVGGHGQQIAQFGGKGPNAEPNTNVIFYRGLSFGGAQSQNPALSFSTNTIRVQKADGSGDADLTAASIGVTVPHTPTTAFEACATGTISWDANFVYVCIAPNTWRRSALAAW